MKKLKICLNFNITVIVKIKFVDEYFSEIYVKINE